MIQDRTALNNYIFLGKSESIMNYIDNSFMPYAYDDILKFLKDLVVEVICENIEEAVGNEWSIEAKHCYKTLKAYYEGEKLKNERAQFKKGQSTKKSIKTLA